MRSPSHKEDIKCTNISHFLGRGGGNPSLVLLILIVFSILNSRILYLHVHVHDNNDIDTNSYQHLQQHASTNQSNGRKARVLLGIFSADMVGDSRYRNAFRDLFKIHPNVCRFCDYVTIPSTRETCELMYTFVLGGNPDGPTEIVQFDEAVPILATKKPRSWFSPDFDEPDMTFLNIKENMNDGKSQSWLYYASLEMDKYNIEYVMKIDTDSLLYLDRYFQFAEYSLPPAPYSSGILAGTAVDKAWWNMTLEQKKIKEPYFLKYYSTTHIYAAGQMYIMSNNLAKSVAYVAANVPEARTYAEGHEDHDVSMMVFLSRLNEMDHPIKFVILPTENSWWLHDIKLKFGIGKWKKAWGEETQRMKEIFSTTDKKATMAFGKTTTPSVPTGSTKNVATTPQKQQQETQQLNRSTKTVFELPEITQEMQLKWTEAIEHFNADQLSADLRSYLNFVLLNNSIAPVEDCFSRKGYIERPLFVVEFNADGGKYWSEFASVVRENRFNNADIILLNQMDIGMERSSNINTVEKLAIELQMNYAWGIEFVDVGANDNTVGLSGQAVLSRCLLYDPFLIRDTIDEQYVVNSKHFGSHVGLFLRTGGNDTAFLYSDGPESNHIVVGSIYRLNSNAHNEQVWEYTHGHDNAKGELLVGTAPKNQIGTILGGEISRDICRNYGLHNLDKVKRRLTFPAYCETGIYGDSRVDNICGNFVNYRQREDMAYLPCYTHNGSTTQISSHSIIAVQVH